jgi:hypothetical protein
VIADPLLLPAVYGTEIVVVFGADTVPIVGAEGAVAGKGVIEFEAEDALPVPISLVAAIVNVYA